MRMYFFSLLLFNADMKTIDDIRRGNLALLASEFGGVGALAKLANKSDSQISQWINGSANSGTGKPRGMRSSSCREIEAACDKPLGWMEIDHSGPPVANAMAVSVDPDDPNSYRIQKVKLQLRAGVTGFQTVPEIHDGSTINLPKNWVDRKGFVPETLIAISVVGDSMEPRIYEGDTVVINTSDRKLVDGEVYAVNFEGEAVIKRLVRERGEWWLFSDNPDQVKHRPKGCREGDCHIVGRVVWKGSERI